MRENFVYFVAVVSTCTGHIVMFVHKYKNSEISEKFVSKYLPGHHLPSEAGAISKSSSCVTSSGENSACQNFVPHMFCSLRTDLSSKFLGPGLHRPQIFAILAIFNRRFKGTSPLLFRQGF